VIDQLACDLGFLAMDAVLPAAGLLFAKRAGG
jgi:hypothetical protein